MVVNFVNMNLNERPTLILKNAGGTPLGVLGFAKNVALDLKYNEVSTLQFELPAYADGIDVPYYDDVVGMRVIEVEGIGQFTLVRPKEIGDGVTRTKICEANSLEYEFVYKKISIPNGTYRFYYGATGEDTILGMILELMPSWSVGAVSSTLYNKYRTFDETNENVYNFIKGAVQESFNCIFDFDTTTRRINVRDANETPASKPVYISTDNLAKEIEITENTEDIVTRLDVNGAEGVDIRDVNPTGTNKIIKLDYFMTTDNFSQSLINKYYAWQSLCDSMRTTYYNLSVKYGLAIMEKATEQAKLVDLQGELTNLENVLGVTIQAIAQGLQTQADLDAANANIRVKQAEITAKKNTISGIETQISSIYGSIQSIQRQCSFENYFTVAERQQMDKYIKDDEVAESSFVAPTSASYGSEGSGGALTSSAVALTGATIEKIADTYSTIYDIRGGTLSVNGISATVIGGVFEKKTANGFMATAYLHHGTYGSQAFQGGSISISGTYSSFTDSASSGTLRATVTGYMYFTSDASEYEQRSIAWELFDYGNELMKRLAVPTYSFSVTSANFLALKDFDEFKNHIELGEKVYIALKEGQTIEPICIGVSFSYGDLATLELSFSDSYASGDSEFRLVDLLDKSVSMGKNLSLSRYIYSAFTDTGASNSIRDFMNSALDTAKNAILSSTNQAISWDGAGLRLRRYSNEEQTAFENEQIWMNNNSIVMTDDAWATAKMAIGKFHDAYAGDVWGVVAPALVGTVLAGENLRIESSKKDGGVSVFTVDANGAKLYNSDFEIAKTVSGVTTHILLDPTSGIVIGKSTPGGSLYTLDDNLHKVIDYTKAVFYADDAGNLHIKGTLEAADGRFSGELSAATGTFSGKITAGEGAIGGWTIGQKRLSSGSSTSYVALDSGTTGNNYVFWAGAETPQDARFAIDRNGNMTATNGSFSGTINATNSTFSGSVTAGDGKIGGWTILSNRLYAGSGSSFVCLDANTTDLLYAIWAGHATASAAPFSVKRDGTFKATNATISGSVTATSGTIGGWTLVNSTENGTTLKRLYSGTGTNYVALDAGSTDTEYVFWAGNATASKAPFSVKRNGEVVAKKLTVAASQLSGKVASTQIEDGAITVAKMSTTAQSTLVKSVSTKNQYYLSTSSTALSGGTWSDSTPTWSSNRYVWIKVATTRTYVDNTDETTYSTAIYDKTLTDALSTAASAQSTANTASSAATAAQTTANEAKTAAATAADGAIKSTVSCYYRSTTHSTPSVPGVAIGTSANTDNAWEYVIPEPKRGRYFYTCEQYTFVNSNVSFSTVREISNLTATSLWCSTNDATKIDGSNIYTGSITATQIATGTITANEIKANTITGSELASNIAISTTGSITLNGSGDIILNSNNWIRFNTGTTTDTTDTIVIKPNAIEMSTGSITMKSGSSFTVNSGGTVKINASGSSGSYIYFGNDITISQSNGISASVGKFTTLTVGGVNVLTASSLGYKIVVSSSDTKPSGSNMLWFKPTSVKSASSSWYTGPDRNVSFGNGVRKSFTLTAETNSTLADSTFDYTLTVPFYLINDGSYESGLQVDAYALKDSDTSKRVTFNTFNLGSMSNWQEKEATLTASSTTTNLFKSTGTITVYVTVSGLSSTSYTTNLYLKDSRYVKLTCTDKYASGNQQPCSVYYIP